MDEIWVLMDWLYTFLFCMAGGNAGVYVWSRPSYEVLLPYIDVLVTNAYLASIPLHNIYTSEKWCRSCTTSPYSVQGA
jgi:hypothetical protein